MKTITSLSNEHIKELSKLKTKKYRDEAHLYLIEGFHLVEMASDDLIEVLITNEKDVPNNVSKDLITIVSLPIIEKLSQTKNPEPIIGVCKYKKESNIIGNRILMLDNLQDPGNIGTLIRSSLAFNIDTVILSNDSVDRYNDKLIRSTQGAIFKTNIVVGNLLDSINELKKQNILIIGTSLENAHAINNVKKVDKYAIILGNEGNGVRKEILKMTDINVKIPMEDKIESLNVSVAGGIIMSYFYQK